ncbi:hypothetical protein [Streptomyces sp. 1222.5]|uniref:hypothetical protein n=1 Tax=Streptomyces sp. 1222.5 TaxID=1881026 RepID=UPI003D736AAD
MTLWITRRAIDTVKGAADWFIGDVYMDAVAAAPYPSRGSGRLSPTGSTPPLRPSAGCRRPGHQLNPAPADRHR